MQNQKHPHTATGPEPSAHSSTLYQRAVAITRKHGHTDARQLVQELGISEYQATRYIHRMWDEGYITSQVDMFGACTSREVPRHA